MTLPQSVNSLIDALGCQREGRLGRPNGIRPVYRLGLCSSVIGPVSEDHHQAEAPASRLLVLNITDTK